MTVVGTPVWNDIGFVRYGIQHSRTVRFDSTVQSGVPAGYFGTTVQYVDGKYGTGGALMVHSGTSVQYVDAKHGTDSSSDCSLGYASTVR